MPEICVNTAPTCTTSRPEHPRGGGGLTVLRMHLTPCLGSHTPLTPGGYKKKSQKTSDKNQTKCTEKTQMCTSNPLNCTLPPPCRSPPLVVPRGGWGTVIWSTQNFSLRLIVLLLGDCVVGHYHLHPLHSWQDILLTFAEMELDSTTMFPPGTSVMFIRSTGEPVLAQDVGHSEHGDA